MTGAIYVVTEDFYLVEGIKSYYPQVTLLRGIEEADFINEQGEVTLLIDSRMPVYLLEYHLFKRINIKENVSVVILEMRAHAADQPRGVMNWYMDMTLQHSQIASMIGLCLHFNNSDYFRKKLINFELDRFESDLVRLLRDGESMDFVAEKHAISVKSAYRRRVELHERLGLSNFNEACIFIFKNNLLEKYGER